MSAPDRRWSRWWAAWMAAGTAAELAALHRREPGATFSAQVRHILRSLEEAGPAGRGVRWASSAGVAAFFAWVTIHLTKPF